MRAGAPAAGRREPRQGPSLFLLPPPSRLRPSLLAGPSRRRPDSPRTRPRVPAVRPPLPPSPARCAAGPAALRFPRGAALSTREPRPARPGPRSGASYRPLPPKDTRCPGVGRRSGPWPPPPPAPFPAPSPPPQPHRLRRRLPCLLPLRTLGGQRPTRRDPGRRAWTWGVLAAQRSPRRQTPGRRTPPLAAAGSVPVGTHLPASARVRTVLALSELSLVEVGVRSC